MNSINYQALNPIAVKCWNEFDAHVDNISIKFPNHLILFRGQRNLHPTIRSGRCRPDARIPRDVDRGWKSLAAKMLGAFSDEAKGEHANAILQHYGLATHFVDLTSDSRIAAWFASHQLKTTPHLYNGGSAMRHFETVTYLPSDNPDGYVLVLAIPHADELIANDRLFNLSTLPAECVRPHQQKGWLLLDRPPTEPTPNSFWAATFKIDTKAMEVRRETLCLFPPASEDKVSARMLSLPFVLSPFAYFSKMDDEETDGCFANRVLNVPEYVNAPNDFAVDHTWNDLTIYEPHHMRCWKNWRFDLAQSYPGMIGDIRDTIKITLTPEAWTHLQTAKDKLVRWPELNSDGLFFTFAALDHDKVIEHSAPYHGVWLQRDDELVVEVPMVADSDSLTGCPGHAYFLKCGGLERQTMKGSCECGNPASHDHRVASVLRLSSCLEDQALILIPHPRLDNLGCYVVITGDEGAALKPDVDRFRRVHRAIMDDLKSASPPNV